MKTTTNRTAQVTALAVLGLIATSWLLESSAHAQVLIDPTINSFSSQLSFCCDRKAVYIVNGSGLTAGPSGILGNSDSTHGNAPDGNMWVSDSGDAGPWFVFDLGGTYNLQTTRIWNYNEAGGTAFGPSNILVSASADNVTFTPVTTITLNQAGGTSAEPAQDRSTAASAVRYVKLQILNNYGGGLFGLSEIRFVGAPLTPAITQQPHWQTLPAGSTASFTVSATGPGTLGYVWQKNGTPLPNGGNVAGATSTNLALSNISDTDAGGYSVVVTNVYGAVTSSVAQLLIGGVLVDPALLYYSSELTFCCDRIAIHMVDGSGVAAGASGVVGAYDSTVSSSPNGTMWLNVDNSTDPQPVLIFDLNGFFDLKIVRLWNYNEGGGNQANGVQTFEIAVSADNVNYTVLGTQTMNEASGADGEPAQDFAVAAPGIRYVRLHLLSNYGAGRFGLSEVRFEGIPDTPVVTRQPKNVTQPAGTTASFTVTASGSPTLIYRWRKGGVPLSNSGNISGATTTNLLVSGIGIGDKGNYDVVVTNSLGAATSSVAKLLIGGEVIKPSVASFSSQVIYSGTYFLDRGASRTADFSGLAVGPSGVEGGYDSTHGNTPNGTMWITDSSDEGPSITYDLGSVGNLYVTRIWNYNSGEAGGAFLMYGWQDVQIAVSPDNVTYNDLGTITLAEASGGPQEPAQDFDTPAAGIRYVQLTMLSDYLSTDGHRGLSEVRFEGVSFTQSPILLNYSLAPAGLVLSWTNSAYFLASATNVSGPYLPVSGATSPWTNTINQAHQFFRLQY